MKILQVFTLLGTNGEYGGPSQVSLNQAEALSKLGHEIEILAGVTRPNVSVKNINVKLNLITCK